MAMKKCYFPECYDNNIKWNDEDLTKFKGKNYCFHHYPEVLRDSEEREELLYYIRGMMHVSYPSGLVLGQIKKFHNDMGYSYKGIKEALELIAVTPSVVIDNNRGIGIVPWYYDKAQEIKHRKADTSIEDETKKHVYVSTNTLNKRKKLKSFDFSS